MPSFFSYDTAFINSFYAMDIAIENYLKEWIFPNETNLSRIEYASNEYTFRQRTANNNGVLNLPYINYHVKAGGITYNNDFNWRNFSAYNTGIFVDELGKNIQLMPISVDYECTFWCTRDDEAKYINSKVIHNLGTTRTPLPFSVMVKTTEIPLFNRLVFDMSEIDGQYTERDWLERNKIHSVTMDFHVMGFALQTTADADDPVLPTSIIYEFTTAHEIDEAYTEAERYTFIIDRFNETVTPETP